MPGAEEAVKPLPSYTNSPLATYTNISPHNNAPRNKPITKITPHHAAGVMSLESLSQTLISRNISANYCISGGRIGLTLDEKNRPWTSSSQANDQTAVTVEIANSAEGGNWPISDKDIEAFIQLSVDVCRRNGIPRLYYDGTPNGTLTLHRDLASTLCPGPYFISKIPYICERVNAEI